MKESQIEMKSHNFEQCLSELLGIMAFFDNKMEKYLTDKKRSDKISEVSFLARTFVRCIKTYDEENMKK